MLNQIMIANRNGRKLHDLCSAMGGCGTLFTVVLTELAYGGGFVIERWPAGFSLAIIEVMRKQNTWKAFTGLHQALSAILPEIMDSGNPTVKYLEILRDYVAGKKSFSDAPLLKSDIERAMKGFLQKTKLLGTAPSVNETDLVDKLIIDNPGFTWKFRRGNMMCVVNHEDILTLKHRAWVNSAVIMACLLDCVESIPKDTIIVDPLAIKRLDFEDGQPPGVKKLKTPHAFAIHSYVYLILELAKQIQVAHQYARYVMPCLVNENHWVGVFALKTGTNQKPVFSLTVYDSLNNDKFQKEASDLAIEYLTTNCKQGEDPPFFHPVTQGKTAVQSNSFDCGVLVIKNLVPHLTQDDTSRLSVHTDAEGRRLRYEYASALVRHHIVKCSSNSGT